MNDSLDTNLYMCWEHCAIRNISQVRYFETGVEMCYLRVAVGIINYCLYPLTAWCPICTTGALLESPTPQNYFIYLGSNGNCCVLKKCCTFSVLSPKQFYILGDLYNIHGRSSRFYQWKDINSPANSAVLLMALHKMHSN